MNTLIAQTWKGFSQSIGNILPPQSKHDYQKLVRLADQVADSLDQDESLEGLFDLLTEYIARWEERELPLEPVSPHQMLAFYMQQQGLSQSDLAREGLMDQGNLSKILSGERPIGLELAKRLATRFHTSPAVFLIEALEEGPSAHHAKHGSSPKRRRGGTAKPAREAFTTRGVGGRAAFASKPSVGNKAKAAKKAAVKKASKVTPKKSSSKLIGRTKR